MGQSDGASRRSGRLTLPLQAAGQSVTVGRIHSLCIALYHGRAKTLLFGIARISQRGPSAGYAVSTGGQLWLSGILDSQQDEVSKAYRAQGLRLTRTLRRGKWIMQQWSLYEGGPGGEMNSTQTK